MPYWAHPIHAAELRHFALSVQVSASKSGRTCRESGRSRGTLRGARAPAEKLRRFFDTGGRNGRGMAFVLTLDNGFTPAG